MIYCMWCVAAVGMVTIKYYNSFERLAAVHN